jgi:hypothetical protein
MQSSNLPPYHSPSNEESHKPSQFSSQSKFASAHLADPIIDNNIDQLMGKILHLTKVGQGLLLTPDKSLKAQFTIFTPQNNIEPEEGPVCPNNPNFALSPFTPICMNNLTPICQKDNLFSSDVSKRVLFSSSL